MFSCLSKNSVVTEESKKKDRQEKEDNLLRYYDLKTSIDYNIEDVEIRWNNNNYTIHTIIAGKQNKDVMVLLHGYGGSNVHYSRMYKELIKHVKIYAIDLPGMGYSSKQDISISNYDDTVEYFMSMIELWRQQVKLDSFCLVGHSFGGHIATLYAVKYPQFIQQLFLLSPAGTTSYTQEEISQKQDFSKESWLKRMAIGFVQRQWQQQTTPQQINNKWFGSILINKYLNKRMKLEGNELEVWKAYTSELLQLPEGSEKALFILFQFPRVLALISIEVYFYYYLNFLNSLKQLIQQSELYLLMPIHFYFGQSDWMDKKGAIRLNKKYKQTVSIEIVEDAGHQLNFENAKGLIQKMLNDYNDSKQNFKQIKKIKKKSIDQFAENTEND